MSIVVLLSSFAGLSLTTRAQQGLSTVNANVEELQTVPQRRLLTVDPVPELAPVPEDFDKVQLVPGTLLSMDVYGVDELSNIMLRLDGQGDVSLPALGPLHLAGKTIGQAQEAVTQALLSGEILVNPVVRLSVVQYAVGYVSLSGEVQSPGRYQMIAPRSLSEVLALAGGETPAAGSDIEVEHAGGSRAAEAVHIHFSQRDSPAMLRATLVSPGDSVFVRRAGVVYVLGAVNKPGGYLMIDSGALNVYQALSLAGGTALDAAKNGAYIIRPHGDSYEELKVPFSHLDREKQSEAQLQADDVLYVPRSGWRITFLDGSAILGAAVGGAIYSAK